MPAVSWIILFFLLLPFFASAQPNSSAGPPLALVVTAAVEMGAPRLTTALVGTAEPRYSALVASEVEGLVEAFFARRGRQVERGQILAQLRTYPVEMQLAQARAAIGEIQSRIQKAESDLQRAQNLHRQGFISEEELQSRQTDLTSVQQALAGQQAAARGLEDRLARMTIRAPFSGRIAQETTEIGQWLREGDTLAALDDLSVIHVMVPVPEGQLSHIRVNQSVQVRFDALAQQRFTGRVSAIVPRADQAARTFPVQIEVANPNGLILGGMLARVSFQRDLVASTLLVPKDALILKPDGSGQVARVIDQQIELVDVRILAAADEAFAVEIVEGRLVAGDQVVIRGNERLRPGQRVRISNAPESRTP